MGKKGGGQHVNMSTMGSRLKYARLLRKYTQVQLANAVGVSRGVITNIEGGLIKKPKMVFIVAISSVLNINSVWLISGEGSSGLEEEAVMTKTKSKDC